MRPVRTRTPTGKNFSKIEDFFDEATKATVIAAKTFNEGNKFDAKKHYGKRVFAHKVVRPKADIIDVTGFHPLLKNIVAAISHYKAQVI